MGHTSKRCDTELVAVEADSIWDNDKAVEGETQPNGSSAWDDTAVEAEASPVKAWDDSGVAEESTQSTDDWAVVDAGSSKDDFVVKADAAW